MNRARFNSGIFILEGLNAVSTAFYFNYLFFFLRIQFGFSSFHNLLVCALNGFLYMFAAYYGGRFGQKRGYMKALGLGLVIMLVAMIVGYGSRTIPGTIAAMVIWTLGVCLTWPNLEALTCDHQDPKKLPRIIGLYNVVWSGGGAIAYFSGGAIAEAFGWRSIYWIPATIFAIELVLVIILSAAWKRICVEQEKNPFPHDDEHHPEGPKFLKMAWLANPFAYIAMNAAIPLIPDLANRLGLSAKQAGFFCSIWFFSRMTTFAILALWQNWHYRFLYLVLSYAGMLASFAAMLLLNSLWMIVLVQISFGWCVGLIYYSSLYYSMHVGETKGEHGGFHEAAIGAGIFGGPAIGAASLYLLPHVKGSSVYGVAAVLLIGLVGLIRIKGSRQTRSE